MLKRIVTLTSAVMVCAAMFISVGGCGDKKPATPAPTTTGDGGTAKPAEDAPKP
jgi:hypothetical protein